MQQAMLQQQAMQQQAMQQQAMQQQAMQQQAMQQQAMQQQLMVPQPLMMQQPMQQQLMQQQPMMQQLMQQQPMMQAPAIPMQVVPTHYSAGHMFCKNCGAPITKVAAICLKCGAAQQGAADLFGADGEKSPTTRTTFVLLAVLLGPFGVHNFIAGYKERALLQLLATVVTFGILGIVIWGWAVLEAITVMKDSKGRPFS